MTKQYPAWRYHTDGRSCIVQDEAEDKELNREAGWFKDPGFTRSSAPLRRKR